jgi:UDP-2,3-diacylglucosamine pyrophosphatase LpxH
MTNYLNIIKQAGETPESITSRRFAVLAGCGKTKALEILKALRDGRDPAIPVLAETSDLSGDTWEISIPKTRIYTLEQLLEHCKVDLTKWVVERFTVNKWEMASADKSDQIHVEPLFQVKATLVKAKGMTIEAVKNEIAALKKDAGIVVPTPKRTFRKSGEGNCLEISVYDAHYGRLSWGEETLWEDYDLSIASKEYNAAIDSLLNRCNMDLEEIVFVVGNDLFHVDNPNNTTTKGTPQDVDSRYHKIFRRVRLEQQKQIEKMRKISPKVKVIFSPGNHDELSSWHLGDSIECLYQNAKDVEVLNTPAPRKYYRWGNVLIMYCHGHAGKRANYPLIMATEQPRLWADTCFHEVHTGHTHQDAVKELMGCKVRTMPALCPPDDWHSQNGYVGNLRGGMGFQWNKKEGLIGTVEYSILSER